MSSGPGLAARHVAVERRDLRHHALATLDDGPHLAARPRLAVVMRHEQARQARHVALEARLLHQARIARRDGLGHRELVGGVADVLQAPHGAVARQGRRHEALLALVRLPHRGVHGPERRVRADHDLLVLVALALDAALALLDLRRQPGHVEVQQRLQAKLHVGPRAELLGRSQEEAHDARVDVGEEPGLLLGPVVVLDEGDLGARHAGRDQAVADPVVDREAPLLPRRGRAEVGEHDLGRAPPLHRPTRGVEVDVVGRLAVGRDHVVDHEVELVAGLVVRGRVHEAHVHRGVPPVRDHRQDDVVPRLRRARPVLDRVDAQREVALVRLEGPRTGPPSRSRARRPGWPGA